MAIDGLSLSNINKFKDKESIEIQNEVAKIANKESELTVQKVKESSSKGEEKKDAKKKKNSAEQQEEEQFLLEDQAEKKKKEQGKKYTVIFNKVNNAIEVIDKEANYVIESLEPKDLINILKKTKNPSGILANHSI